MPRPKGSKNKRTLEREAAARAAVGQQQSLIAAAPFSEAESRRDGVDLTPLPPAPVSTQEFIEYSAPNGDRWRIENGPQLLSIFDLESSDVVRWHEALAPEKSVWHVLRSFFGAAPLVGETNPEYLRPRGLEEIGKPLGLTSEQIQEQIDSAKQFWTRWRVANKVKFEPPPSIVATPTIPKEEVDMLLLNHGLPDIEGADKRQFAAQRLRDFKHKLDDEEGRTLVVQVVRLELQMSGIDKIIQKLNQTASTVADDRNAMERWLKMYDGISERHLKVMEALNATQAQNPSAARKVAFIDCLGTLVKGIQEYEAIGDTALIDGVHTAGEIKFLITPSSLRPAQYRLDLMAIVNDSCRHHNLFNPDYVPPSLDRATFRRMMKSVQEALRATAESDGTLVEMEDDEAVAPSPEFERPNESAVTIPGVGETGAAVPAVKPRRREVGGEFALG